VHCREHAVRLHRAHAKFEAAGLPVVMIGQATPRHAAHFRRRLELEFPVLADERRESYRAAGAKVGTMAEVAGAKSVAAGALATIRSAGKVQQGRVIGHAYQLGGTMVVAPDGTVVWSHMSENASDNASPEEILEAAAGVAP
jgi:peroxiredoxin